MVGKNHLDVPNVLSETLGMPGMRIMVPCAGPLMVHVRQDSYRAFLYDLFVHMEDAVCTQPG